MTATQVRCRFLPGSGSIRLRELSGWDEQMVADTGTASAIQLLDRLILPAGDGGEAIRARSLTASDRDRLMAHVYARNFGRKVQSSVRCVRCRELFDLEFDMHELARVLDAPLPASVETLKDGTFRLQDGVLFRLPTGEDELRAAGRGAEARGELLRRCVVAGGDDGVESMAPAVEQAMEDIAPVLDLNLNAQCPECGAKQSVHFNVQHYLLRAIQQAWKPAAREVHLLATAYGWSLREILELPRSQRRLFVELIENERSSRTKARA